MTLRIVVGDDSLLAREGILRVLEGMPEIEVVGVAQDLDSLRETVDRTSPDIVLSDIRMPPTHTDKGIRLAAELRTTHPDTGLVVLSQHSEPEYATALFATGSERRGYLLKERPSATGTSSSEPWTRLQPGGSHLDGNDRRQTAPDARSRGRRRAWKAHTPASVSFLN